MSEAPNEIFWFSVVHMIPTNSSSIDHHIDLFTETSIQYKVDFSLCV